MKSLIPSKVRNIHEIARGNKITQRIDPNIPLVHTEPEHTLFNRNVKFEQDNDFALKMIQRMREARKNAPAEPGSKEELVSEEVKQMRKQNEMELKEFEDEINLIQRKKKTINEEYRQLESK